MNLSQQHVGMHPAAVLQRMLSAFRLPQQPHAYLFQRQRGKVRLQVPVGIRRQQRDSLPCLRHVFLLFPHSGPQTVF